MTTEKRAAIVHEFLQGLHERDDTADGKSVGELEDANPSFNDLGDLLDSEFVSAQAEAAYVLYNRDGVFPEKIKERLKVLAAEGHPRVRGWAEANVRDFDG
jgi:hypothetical protein